jgi:succinate dehydrogenase / fumarate reductase cytochrome b subunit
MPLSPHLSIYRPEFTSVTSIFTRITGNALLIASLLIVWWIFAASGNSENFETVNKILNSWFVKIILFLSLWAFWYHFLAGLRHLYWDTGRGFDLIQAKYLAYGVIAGSFVLTLLTAINL